MVTKKLVVGKLEILEDGQIQVRKVLRAFDDDGSLIGERFDRSVLEPGQDVSKEEKRTQDVAKVVWTPQVIDDFKKTKKLNKDSIPGEKKL